MTTTSGYQRVQVAGDTWMHYAGIDTDHTIGRARAIIAERVQTRRCGALVVRR